METSPQPQGEEKIVIPPYRSPECHNKSFQVMNTLREQNQLCDVLLKAADNEIPAHRVVLASSSPYFFAMFTGELSESRQTVTLHGDLSSGIVYSQAGSSDLISTFGFMTSNFMCLSFFQFAL